MSVTLFLLITATAFTLFNSTDLSFYSELYTENAVFSITVFCTGTVIGILLLFAMKKINALCDVYCKRVSYILFALMGIVMLIFACVFAGRPLTDGYFTLQQASALANGSEQYIDESMHYFTVYGNNNMFVLIHTAFFKVLDIIGVSDRFFAVVMVNVIVTFTSHIFVFNALKKLLSIQKATSVLLLIALNPVYYLCLPWVYTCTYSLLPMSVILNLIAQIARCKRKFLISVYSVLMGAVAVIGYLIRPTAIFFLIAFVVCGVLYILKRKDMIKRACIVGLCVIIGFCSVFAVMNECIEAYVEDGSKHFPLTHWIMLGLNKTGQYDRADYIFTSQYVNTDEMRKGNIEEICRRIKDRGIVGTAAHAIKKLGITFSSGGNNCYRRTSKDCTECSVYDYIYGEKRNAFMLYAQGFRFATLILACVSIWHQIRKRNDVMLLFSVTLLGGMVFYILWEAKAEYSIPFLSAILILAADGTEHISLHNTSKKLRKLLYIVSALFICVSIVGYVPYVKQEMSFTDYSLDYGSDTLLCDYPKITDNGKLTQIFYAAADINTVELSTKITDKNSTAKYSINLYRCGSECYKQTVSAADVKGGKIYLRFSGGKSDNHVMYCLKITPYSTNTADSIVFRHMRTNGIDLYPGKCTQGGDERTDMYINAYKKYSGNYYSAVQYAFFITIAAVVMAAAHYLIRRKLNDKALYSDPLL